MATELANELQLELLPDSLREAAHHPLRDGYLAVMRALPRADALPSFVTELSEVPSTSNPLGLRGGGEGGTTPALGAVVNAVVDALAEFGVEHLDMPVTPERVWRAIHGGK